MPKPGPRTTYRYSRDFNATAVRLSQLQDMRVRRYAGQSALSRSGCGFRGKSTLTPDSEKPGRRVRETSWRQRICNHVVDNPLGARALYLYRGGRDSMFRIHGTIQNDSIGHATSAGCIRLFNQDAIELYERVDLGTRVKVRSLEESLAIEGPYMDDAYGRAVPETPENIAKKEVEALEIIEAEAAKVKADALAAEKAAKEAAKADKKRLSACKRNGIDAADCPPLPEELVADAS